jgi:hypothetical protein
MAKKIKTEDQVPVAQSNKKEDGPIEDGQLKSVEIIKVDRLAGVEGFNPRENLRTITSGVWRYICHGDVKEFDEKHFHGALAKDFGIKSNDVILLVGNRKHRIVVV